MNTVIDTLFLRRPKLDYLSPGICEAIFSSTGFPIIVLPEIGKLLGPTGLLLSGTGTSVRLSWNTYPGALCYNVYTSVLTTDTITESCSGLSSTSSTLEYRLFFECLATPFTVIPRYGCYRITAITADGETDLSDPICTCEYSPTCPTGFHWDPYFLTCACDPLPCLPGDTWDELLCQCVGCGTQQCPPGFHPNPGNPCECLPCSVPNCPPGFMVSPDNNCSCVEAKQPESPPPLDPITVCNDAQTAHCDPPNEDVTATVDADMFCKPVYNPTTSRVEAAKAEMNSAALAAAEDELVCPGSGFKICNWECVHDAISTGLTTPVSILPRWNGVFDSVDASTLGPFWYFKDQSISNGTGTAGIKLQVSATEAPDYPDGDWQNLDSFSKLYFDGVNWFLLLSTIDGQIIWNGMGDSVDSNNPAGTYTNSQPGNPQTIHVVSSDTPCVGLDFSTTTWSDPQFNGFVTGFLTGNGATLSFDLANTPPETAGFNTGDPAGQVIYGGIGPICGNMHVVITEVSGVDINIQIFVFTSEGTASSAVYGPGDTGVGVYDIPFTILSGQTVTLAAGGGGHGHVVGSVTFSTL